ncbi:hypothetical protein ACIQUS_24625 [Pseudomonas sp. NPDC090755]|uniref:hypothetical protein n=1 Tax=Pseudomonas sp. NPDC090755 TaxID=3364481 RepID=UPI00383A1EE7
MIDINTWPPSVAIAFGLAPFVIGLSGVAMSIYIACSRDFDLMLSSLPKSNWLNQQILFWGTERLKSRYYLVNTICAAMLYPPFGIKRGLIDAEEVRDFPRSLRCRMVASAVLVIIGAIWLAIGLALIKLSPTR